MILGKEFPDQREIGIDQGCDKKYQGSAAEDEARFAGFPESCIFLAWRGFFRGDQHPGTGPEGNGFRGAGWNTFSALDALPVPDTQNIHPALTNAFLAADASGRLHLYADEAETVKQAVDGTQGT